jgi:Putative MetA-pathway of phenol degradation
VTAPAGIDRRLLFVGINLALSFAPITLYAQFSEAHHYDNTPVGTNQIEAAYSYARSDASIDTSLIVTGAHVRLNQAALTYTRYFGLFDHLLWAEGSVPLAYLSGSIGDQPTRGISGAGDSSYTFGALLTGAPALSAEQFGTYRHGTTSGMSLEITAPTGQYNSGRLLNLGSDRWSFKPEIAVSHSLGRAPNWQWDLYAHARFFTDNTSYRGTEVLRQDALPGIEGHVSYSFEKVWVSIDTLYAFRGTTYVNGVDQGNAQRNFTLGSEINISLNAQHSLVIQFAKALVHQNAPPYTGFTVKYAYTWGKGYP